METATSAATKPDKVAVTRSTTAPATTPATVSSNDFFAPFLRPFPANPFALMREFTNQMDRVFSGFPATTLDTEFADWAPAVEVRKANGDLVVTAEVPGLKKEEIKVEVTGDNLVIQGDRKKEHEEDREGFHRSERCYGHFFRSIPLPEGAKTNEVKAELHDGVLKITVPTPKIEKKARTVQIAG